ncbi:MAG: RdgB/HAM1 family non-canonical purine NTP pyrophosphatase [Myxococcales bacterium]|nr:RdgB/HAM1 family non-canonical purine NTP pyrophosphatase [Myxococcales bacterium]
MKLVFATQNRGKLVELRALVVDLGLTVISFEETGFRGEIVEDAATFAGNARKKAEEVSQLTGWPALGDDSGLEVDALGGAPGVLSARFAGAGAARSDEANNRKLLSALAGIASPRTARFRCALALARPGAPTVVEEGVCEGEILDAPRGSGGFGYDPLFLVPSLGRTMAELPAEEKNRISHRGHAMARMRPHLGRLAKALQPQAG